MSLCPISGLAIESKFQKCANYVKNMTVSFHVSQQCCLLRQGSAMLLGHHSYRQFQYRLQGWVPSLVLRRSRTTAVRSCSAKAFCACAGPGMKCRASSPSMHIRYGTWNERVWNQVPQADTCNFPQRAPCYTSLDPGTDQILVLLEKGRWWNFAMWGSEIKLPTLQLAISSQIHGVISI